MLLGLFAIVMMLAIPKGIAGLLADRFDIQIFPLRRRVRLEEPK
jgi:branched-chain amino acid transport system permease protein